MAILLVGALISSSTAACGGAVWPRVNGLADPEFLHHQRAVDTVDLMPVDLQVWTMPGHARDPFDIAGQLSPYVSGMVTTELARRGYEVVAQIDREGRYVGHDGRAQTAMTADDLARTSYALSSYGRAQSRVQRGLLVPYLPARLGAATGSQATLYIGGWAFAGKERRSSKAGDVLKVLLVVGIVAVIAVAIIGGSKKGGGGGVGRAAGKVARGAGQVAAGAARVAGRVAVGTVRTAGRIGYAMMRDPEVFDAVVDTAYLMARAGTHVQVYSSRPDYYAEGPRDGRSAMLLEMTLIDNRTGRTLWHARQEFPASPTRPGDVARAVHGIMTTLPAH
jgi:hypothetical protein